MTREQRNFAETTCDRDCALDGPDGYRGDGKWTRGGEGLFLHRLPCEVGGSLRDSNGSRGGVRFSFVEKQLHLPCPTPACGRAVHRRFGRLHGALVASPAKRAMRVIQRLDDCGRKRTGRREHHRRGSDGTVAFDEPRRLHYLIQCSMNYRLLETTGHFSYLWLVQWDDRRSLSELASKAYRNAPSKSPFLSAPISCTMSSHL